MAIIRTTFVALMLALAILIVLPPLMLWSVITRKPDLMYYLAMKIVQFGTRLLGVRVRVEGLENVPSGPCVFVANHASTIDPLALVPALPQRVGIVAKQELFRIPVFGRAMRIAQFVPVDRGDKESTTTVVPLAEQYVKQGLSFMFFSEGTRSPDGRLRPFKRGAFTLAINAGVPVVPVSIVGAHHLMRKGHSLVYPGDVTIRFGSPVDASDYTLEQRGNLLARVEALVAAGLPADQQPA
ncbi:MAG TPA: lysophospholipid acyltransferase family protein [Candidatus Acidoferrales bacterium]|nr:lysophospholipid acyltransferase family protein [Candidatus Acidoferrales bacterium]